MMIEGHRDLGRRELRRGFTLTEMLVVIAIIGILAGILLGALPAVTEKRVRSQVQAELRMLLTAIEAYKEKHGFYPPANTNNIAQAPLFYELTGTRVVPGASLDTTRYYSIVTNNHSLTGTEVKNKFGAMGDLKGYIGFLNSAEDASEVKNFLQSLQQRQYCPSPYDSSALLLRVSAKGVKDPNFPTEEFNTWRYVVADPGRPANATTPYPTNNPNTFDLWADVAIGGKIITIGNWKK